MTDDFKNNTEPGTRNSEPHAIAHGAIAWMAHNPVAANLLMIVCLVGGLLMLSKITQEVFPSTDRDIVRIRTSYPGASPEEIEQGLILVIEEAVRGLDGVHEVSSAADEGRGTVNVALLEG